MKLLLIDISEVGEHLSNIGHGLSYKHLTPVIKRAQQKYILPVIGESLLATLTAEFEEDQSSASSSASSVVNSISEVQYSELKKLCQDALAHIAFSLYIPNGDLKIKDHSMHKAAPDDTEQLNYFEKQEAAQDYLEIGLEAIDRIYAYLEKNTAAFAAWNAGAEAAHYNELFIRTCADFNSMVDISESYRTFKTLAPIMRSVETLGLSSKYDSELLNELRTKQKSTLTAPFTEILDTLKRHIAHLSASKLMLANAVKIDRNAIVQIESAGDHITKKYSAERSEIAMARNYHQQEAAQYLDHFEALLNKHADSIDNYTAPSTTTSVNRDVLTNRAGKIIGF